MLKGLPYAKVKEIAKGLPIDYLDELRSQVNLPPIGQGRTIVKHAPEGGMLRGADEMIDQSLSLRDVKYQSKTAALRCTKHRAIGMPVF